jgi:hypothetical protein
MGFLPHEIGGAPVNVQFQELQVRWVMFFRHRKGQDNVGIPFFLLCAANAVLF